MLPQKLIPPLEDFVEGHTFRGIPAVTRLDTPEGGVPGPPESALTKVEMIWVKRGNATETFTLSSDGVSPAITILSAINWEFTIPKKIIPEATPGVWEWIISCYGSDADEKDPILKGAVTVHESP